MNTATIVHICARTCKYSEGNRAGPLPTDDRLTAHSFDVQVLPETAMQAGSADAKEGQHREGEQSLLATDIVIMMMSNMLSPSPPRSIGGLCVYGASEYHHRIYRSLEANIQHMFKRYNSGQAMYEAEGSLINEMGDIVVLIPIHVCRTHLECSTLLASEDMRLCRGESY
ncbi:hypothetical protein BDW22DRAFT_560391 [Trametopsis cervina]|nr:hypothetical protein BDW22DRAFT_560391 [Trametopsis cervina]